MIDFEAIKKALKAERTAVTRLASRFNDDAAEHTRQAKYSKAEAAKYKAQARSCDLALKAFGEKQDEIEARKP